MANLNWDCKIKQHRGPFIPKDDLEKHSLVHQLLSGAESWDTIDSDSGLANPLYDAQINAIRHMWQTKQTEEQRQQDDIKDLTEKVAQRLTEELWVAPIKPPRLLPRLSAWSRMKQRFVVDMLVRYWATGVPAHPPPAEAKDVARLVDYIGAMREEQEEYFQFARDVNATQLSRYNFIKSPIDKYMHLSMESKIRLLKRDYPSHYHQLSMLPLAPPVGQPPNFYALSQPLELGQVPVCVIPSMNRYTDVKRQTMFLNLFFPPGDFYPAARGKEKQPRDGTYLYKTPVSADPNMALLSTRQEFSVVATPSVLKTLLDNCAPHWDRQWEVPVTVRLVPGTQAGTFRRVVFLDKPLPPRSMHNIERNTRALKRIVRLLVCKRVTGPGPVDYSIWEDQPDRRKNRATTGTSAKRKKRKGKKKKEPQAPQQQEQQEQQQQQQQQGQQQQQQEQQQERQRRRRRKRSKRQKQDRSLSEGEVVLTDDMTPGSQPPTCQSDWETDDRDSDTSELLIDWDEEPDQQAQERQVDDSAAVEPEPASSVAAPTAGDESSEQSSDAVDAPPGHSVPVGGGPVGQSPVPAGGVGGPVGQSSVPAGGVGGLVGQSPVPAGGVGEPVGQSSLPAGGVSGPAIGSLPVGQSSVPPGGVGGPVGQSSVPGSGVGGPVGQSSVPAGGVGRPTEVAEAEEWRQQDVDDPALLRPPPGLNVHYRVWQLGSLRLLLRATTHAMRDNPAIGRIRYTVHAKPAYQPGLGIEVMTRAELVSQWLDCLVRPHSRIVRVHVDPVSQMVITPEERTLGQLTEELIKYDTGFKPQYGLQVLESLLRQLTALEPGQYLLSHDSRTGPFVRLSRATDNSASAGIDLHQSFPPRPVQVTLESPRCLNIDPSILTPFNIRYGRVPATFRYSAVPDPNEAGWKEFWSKMNERGYWRKKKRKIDAKGKSKSDSTEPPNIPSTP